jgi:anti-anti-sigma regulatory factor
MFPITAGAFLDDLPLPIIIYGLDGMMILINHAAETFWGLKRAEHVGISNAFNDSTAAVVNLSETYARVRNGEIITRAPTRDITGANTEAERPIWYQAIIFPVRTPDAKIHYAGYIYYDVTAQMEQSARMTRAEEEIATQQALIQELSFPVVEVWEGILLAPLVGAMDARRATAITERLLMEIVRFGVDVVIMDVTGLPHIDIEVAAYLVNAARAVRMLGSDIVLTGMSSALAQTVVQIGIDLSQFETQANLQAGLAWALAHRNLRVTRQP